MLGLGFVLGFVLGLGLANLGEQRLRLLAPLLHARRVPLRRGLLSGRRPLRRVCRLLEPRAQLGQPPPQHGSLEVEAEHLVRVRVRVS